MLCLWQEVAWAEYDEETSSAILNFCFDCADLVGRLRPDLTHDAALDLYNKKDGSRADPNFHAHVDSAKERAEEEDPDPFRPGVLVSHEHRYSRTIYQDFGCVTSEEFYTYTGLTPSQAGAEPLCAAYPKPPSVKGAKAPTYYLLGLDGLTCGQVASIRKCRFSFSDDAFSDDQYLTPQDQLVADQGLYVLLHAFKKKRRAALPEVTKPSAKQPKESVCLENAKSVEEYKKLAELNKSRTKKQLRFKQQPASWKRGEETKSWR